MRGGLDELGPIAAATQAEVLIVAIAQADSALLRRVQDLTDSAGLTVKVMPPIGHVVAHGVRGNELRDLSIEDLLGRQPASQNASQSQNAHEQTQTQRLARTAQPTEF